MANVTLAGLISLENKYRSINIHIPNTNDTEYLFDGIYLPSVTTYGAKAYWPDVRSKHIVQNWNTAYPSLEWEQPFYAYGMNGPVLYEIVQAPSGMTMVGGRMTRNPVTGFFDYQSAVLTWNNPVVGRYRIGIRATDQTGQKVYWIFDLFVDAARNFFMALNATGDGLGGSPSNCASWANTILGQTTNSPSKNKVLRIKGDEYPERSQLRPDQNFTAASWCAMPAETPVFLQRFNLGSDNIHLHNIKFQGVGTSDFGVVNGQGSMERIGVWGVEFDECYMIGSSGGNQSCIGFNKSFKSTNLGRERIFVADTTFKNSTTIHGYDFYAMQDYAFVNNRLLITDGTTTMAPSWIFPKLQAMGEIMYNVADVPSLSTTNDSVIQLLNAWEPNHPISYDLTNRCEYNFVRTGGANVLRSNGDNDGVLSTIPENTITNYIKRNTFIGGNVSADFFGTNDPRTQRNTYFESNIILHNGNSGAGGAVKNAGSLTDWFFNTGENISGNTASAATLLDANYAPSDTSKYGLTGAKIWRPE